LGAGGNSGEERIKQSFLPVTEGKLSPRALQSLGNAPKVRAPAQRPTVSEASHVTTLPILSILSIPQGGERRRESQQRSRADGITYSAEGACAY